MSSKPKVGEVACCIIVTMQSLRGNTYKGPKSITTEQTSSKKPNSENISTEHHEPKKSKKAKKSSKLQEVNDLKRKAETDITVNNELKCDNHKKKKLRIT